MVPIKADGDCCFHLCGVLSRLLVDSDCLSSGVATCSVVDTTAARGVMLSNIAVHIKFLHGFLCDGQVMDEDMVFKQFHDRPSEFVPRINGTARGEGRLGLVNDFGAFTAKTPLQVVVIQTAGICMDTPTETASKISLSAQPMFPEQEKTHVVGVIFNADKGHYDLGALRVDGKMQVMFTVGSEWEFAQTLLLAYVHSHAPARGGQWDWFGHRWQPAEEIREKRGRDERKKQEQQKRVKNNRKQASFSPSPVLSSPLLSSPVSRVVVGGGAVVGVGRCSRVGVRSTYVRVQSTSKSTQTQTPKHDSPCK
jgi:hypothetical protein